MYKREEPATSLSAVTSTGASSAVRMGHCIACAATVKATSVTTGGTLKVQGANTDSSDNDDWWDIDTVTVSADGSSEVLFEYPPPYVRTNLTARTDGTYTTTIAKIGAAGI